jgi:hypothetical protein
MRNNTEDCELECFINHTGFVKNGKIEKNALKNMYQTSSWGDVVTKGADNCAFEAEGPLEPRIMKFFNCLEDFMAKNCIKFNDHPNCVATEGFFEDCKHPEIDCARKPREHLREFCCMKPTIISEKLKFECKSGCKRNHFLKDKQDKCENQCIYIESGLVVDNKVSFEAVKKMLIDNSESLDKWKPVINKTVDECVKAINFESCVSSSLLNNCADWKGEKFCNKIENYMKKCS